MKRLTLPGEMGEKFQAMVLARNITPAALPDGLAVINQARRL